MDIRENILQNIAKLVAKVPLKLPIYDHNATLAIELGTRLRKAAGTFVGLRANPAVMAQMKHSLQEGVDAFCDKRGWVGEPPSVEVEEIRPGEFSCRVMVQSPHPRIRLVQEY